MSFEFNKEDSAWSIPNPFRIENIFLAITGVIFLVGAISLTLVARTYLQDDKKVLASVTMLVAAILFGGAFKHGVQALSQLRFFFGRQFPLGLASQLPAAATGDSPEAVAVREVLRQRAVEFPEPKGPLNGILYTLIKKLITSPPTMQAAASQHFHSLVTMGAIWVSMCVTMFLTIGTPHEGVISWAYLPLTGLSLLTPFMNRTAEMPDEKTMMWKVMAFTIFAIAGPVIIQHALPPLNVPPMWAAPALLLVGSMVASGLFLMAVFSQIDDVRSTDVSCVQTTIAMNCPPSQIWTEVSRSFQDNWVRNIPNRTYTNTPPDVSTAERGSFSGAILEETQPMPTKAMTFEGIKDAWSEGYSRFLILLAGWGILLAAIASGIAMYTVGKLETMHRMEISRFVLIIIALEICTVLSFKIGHLLWSRMYFRSRLILIETSGTFQTSVISIGNQFKGNTNSSSTLTRVEDATLRVWTTDIVSVAFGKDSARCIMSMEGADQFVKDTADHLITFAADQSAVATITSAKDIVKAKQINALNRMLSEDESLPVPIGKLGRVEVQQITVTDESVRESGTVKYFNHSRQFGFITGADKIDRFFNANQTKGVEFNAGDAVTFFPSMSPRGPKANRIERK